MTANTSAPTAHSRCGRHPIARAAWRCQGCEKNLCPKCAAKKTLPRGGEAVICAACGGLGVPLTRPRAVTKWWEMLPAFGQAMFSFTGAMQIFAVALVLWLFDFIPFFFGWLLTSFVFLSYFFRVVSAFAQGAERLPDPDDFLGLGSILSPPLRFLAASLALWLPPLLWLIFGVGLRTFAEEGPDVFSGPVFVLLILGGLAYFPGALITAAVSESILAVLNPLITLRMIARIPGHYLATAITAGALTGVHYLITGFLHAMAEKVYVPLLGSFILTLLGLPIPILTAMIMGRLIYQNGEHFGILRLGEETEPEWPNAKPEATLERVEVAARTHAALPAAVEIEGWDVEQREVLPPAVEGEHQELSLDSSDLPESVEAPSEAGRVEAPPLLAVDAEGFTVGSTDLPPEPVGPDPRLIQLHDALDLNDFPRSIDALRVVLAAGLHPQLEPRLELRLANFLERSGDAEEAVRACQRAVKADAKGPFAARAVYTAARLLAANLRERPRAAAMYQYLIKNFPQDELAMRAQSELSFLSQKN